MSKRILTKAQRVPYDIIAVCGAWVETTTGAMVRDIWERYLEPEGILLGALAPGVRVAGWHMRYERCDVALHRLAEWSGYVCWIDDKDRLHFGPEADRTDWHFY